MKKFICATISVVMLLGCLTGCGRKTKNDSESTTEATNTQFNFTDTLEHDNQARRDEWINNQSNKPFGYVILLTESGGIVGKFTVDGKVSSLNEVDGSNGIFFFTPDGKYVEWSGTYLYSDIPINVHASVISHIVGG